MHISIDLGLANVDFDEIKAIFVSEKWKKRQKGCFYSILLQKPILKLVKKKLLLLWLPIDAHLGRVLAQFQVIAVIFEWKIKKKSKKN